MSRNDRYHDPSPDRYDRYERRDRYDRRERLDDRYERRERYDDRYERRDRYVQDDYSRDRKRRSRYDDSDDRHRRRRDDYEVERRRRRSRSPRRKNLKIEPLNPYRFRDLSRERKDKDDEDSDTYTVELQEKEVAYVFGRQGSTKDKLARVSGTEIELKGPQLSIQGSSESIERAKRYVHILLDQRKASVKIDPADYVADLTLVDVPVDCKGFVTGRQGGTLRKIERECATLMTFCKVNESDDDDEPLAIFGNRRGRLVAQLKIMSVVEGKHQNWFCKEDEPPKVEISEQDINLGGDWGVDFMKLERGILGYALGKGGYTRQKLQTASHCIIQYVGNWAAFGGTAEERGRGRTYLEWLINQRDSDFDVDISNRDDVIVLYVPEPSVGYVTGRKADTLRGVEQKSGTFCFFDKRKDRSSRSKEKMLIFSAYEENRNKAKEEVIDIVEFHQKKIGGDGKVTDTYDPSPPASDRGSASPARQDAEFDQEPGKEENKE